MSECHFQGIYWAGTLQKLPLLVMVMRFGMAEDTRSRRYSRHVSRGTAVTNPKTNRRNRGICPKEANMTTQMVSIAHRHYVWWRIALSIVLLVGIAAGYFVIGSQ